MPAVQLPLALAQPHNNQQLFADHYLNVTLPQRPDWQLLQADASAALGAIAPIVQAFLRAPAQNEAQTEDTLIKPVLRLLGHTTEVQAALRTPDGTKKPDYVFYRDQATLEANKPIKVLDEGALAGRAFAVGDAKHWDRPLDRNRSGGGDPFSNKNPAYQIAFYIQHSGVEWGILTNGRLWRLYHKDTAHKQDRFYEVDLPALVESGDPASFLYFYAFFHRSAFAEHPLSVAALLAESAAYARGVGASLRGQVYEALTHIAQGFLDYPGNGLQPDPATLKQIYDSSLILLYRLLFILYAEARELLPLRESAAYRTDYSLDAIKREVALRRAAGAELLPTTARYWPRLRDLFGIIDKGSPPLKVATFNGGLFDAAKHTFLASNTVGDARLMAALDQLARVDGQFIDYRDLAERHLGTIYEGLLEYHLQPLDPGAAGGAFSIGLFNQNGERHRTGSYYTPDFVVQYIVDQTLKPVLDAAVATATTDAEKIRAVLSINVLDPAMGSGHFPVAAMEYIARYLVDLGVTPTTDDGPLTTDNRPLTADSQPSSVVGRRSSVGEPDLAYWKRRVGQSCIYGVDLNPLAVDLAKLSLWLATAAKDKPLSFLDHHLRTGNALVGTRIAGLDLHQQPADIRKRQGAKKRPVVGGPSSVVADQLSMLDDPAFARSLGLAVDSMWLIETSAGSTIDDVREQERLYHDLRATLTRTHQRLADIATARQFGLSVDPTLMRGLAGYLSRGGFEVPQYAAVLNQAAAQSAAQRFFHWDLEFPEVFFDTHGQPLGERGGFDAVIGNPPYVRQEQLAPLKPYLAEAYEETYAGTADLYVYFVNQGVRLLQRGGRLAYIASNSWLRANYAGPLRNFLRTQATVEQIIDLGDNRVFADAPDVYPAILVARRDTPADDHSAQVAVFNRGEGVRQFEQQVVAKRAPVSIHDQADTGWQLGDDAGRRVFAKLMAGGKAMGEILNGQMYYGVKTGANNVFIIDRMTCDQLVQADPSSAAILKPLIQGEDLRPWYYENQDRWLIFTRRGITIDEYPAVKAYLERFRTQLEPRPKDWNSSQTWQGRKPGSYQWYELQDSVDYYAAFDKPKILWPDITKLPRFSWDTESMFLGNTGYIATPNHPWLLGFLSSRCAWFMISNLAIALGERAGVMRYRLIDQYMRPLPIPDAPAAEREAIGDLAMRITAEARARYELHRKTRARITADLGVPGGKLNQKLTAWWDLDFPTFRAELHKVFKRDIPLKQRDDWDEWLQSRRAEHAARTESIVRLETELNARVYTLFDLTRAEITIIEESTKYKYGEV